MKRTLVILFVIFLITPLFAAEKSSNLKDQKAKTQNTKAPENIKLVENYVAIFDLETQGVDKKISRPLTDSIILEIVKTGKYEVIDRSNMNKVLSEQKFQLSGCVSGQCVVEAGQLLGVGKIIVGSVGIVGSTYYLSLSLINVTTGKIETSSEDKCKCAIDELIESSKRLAKKLMGEKIDAVTTTKPEIKPETTPVTKPTTGTTTRPTRFR
ncbi:MAG: CsgG/HfaB family protein [Nitrospiraceae bacterium]|nr:CsgG/HfaB family protein [Nitrospiraceae bacterium]